MIVAIPVVYSLILPKHLTPSITKLKYYGIRGLAKDWFISYLSDRQQVVIVNNATSTCNVSSGVPQGSVTWSSVVFTICK